ncbi:MAG: PQQ-binding-like beta-propeller repeat protein [Verrucomicrobiae bacterium]|nr:PQQ-binding-like beta-propeller repeat protein [Verrucomicrobiae bacterium]
MREPIKLNARLLTIAVLTLSAVVAWTEDWPRFLGPRGDATSRETGLVGSFPEGGPRRVFSIGIGTGYAAPSVAGRLLVLHHRVGNEEIIDAMDRDSGKPVWTHRYPSHYRDPFGYNNGPRCTPLLTTNRCYTLGAEGRLLCLDLETGKEIWRRDTQRDFNVPEAFFGVGSTPLLEGGLLITMVGGQPDAGVVAFDAESGKTVWKNVGAKTWEGEPMIGWRGERTVTWEGHWKQASYASPVVATVNGRRMVFCLMRQGLVALNPANGEEFFSRWFRATVNESVNAANPVVVGDRVHCSAAYYGVGGFLLQVKPGNRSFDTVWANKSLEVHWMTPVEKDGFLYAFSGRNEPDAFFRCVEFGTGKVRWERDERWAKHSTKQPKVYGRGSIVLADGKLIVLGEGGLLGLFSASPEKPVELARWQVPELHYPCWAAPVLSERRLYLRSEDRLVCLDLSAR